MSADAAIHFLSDIAWRVKNAGSLVGFSAPKTGAWMEEHWWVPWLVSALYLALTAAGHRLMRHRKPFHLKGLLTVWNVLLCAFSSVALWVSAVEFAGKVKTHGPVPTYCKRLGFYTGPMGFWSFVFTLSKVVEFGDTAFLVLRKKPLLFLHYYHHATVLVYTWDTFSSQGANIRWGSAINLAVHSLMYAYFAVRSLGLRLPAKAGMLVTTAQMAQFLVGIAVCSHLAYLHFTQPNKCQVSDTQSLGGLGLYGGYLILFAHFFYKAYVAKPADAKKKAR